MLDIVSCVNYLFHVFWVGIRCDGHQRVRVGGGIGILADNEGEQIEHF
jgi:hypothetical protein